MFFFIDVGVESLKKDDNKSTAAAKLKSVQVETQKADKFIPDILTAAMEVSKASDGMMTAAANGPKNGDLLASGDTNKRFLDNFKYPRTVKEDKEEDNVESSLHGVGKQQTNGPVPAATKGEKDDFIPVRLDYVSLDFIRSEAVAQKKRGGGESALSSSSLNSSIMSSLSDSECCRSKTDLTDSSGEVLGVDEKDGDAPGNKRSDVIVRRSSDGDDYSNYMEKKVLASGENQCTMLLI